MLFIKDGEETCFAFVEELVAHYAATIFAGSSVQKQCLFRVTRNADITVDEGMMDHDIDFRDVMSDLLKKRRKLAAVRLQFWPDAPQEIVKFLRDKLVVPADRCYTQTSPLDSGSLFKLAGRISADGGHTALFYPAAKPMQAPAGYDLYTEVVANAGYIMLFWIIIVAGMKQTRRIMRITLVAVAIVLTLVMMNFSFFPSNITMALCLIGGVGVFFIRGVYPPLAHLVMISLFLPFVMPVGSNAEPSFYGKETCFLTLPLVMYVLFEELMPKKEQLERRAAMCMIGVLGAGLLFFNLTHKQMEEGNRIACRYTVDSQLTRGILTTKENADMYNYLIREVKPHIRQGSYMICSFSLPAVSILDCKPWAVYSTVYSTDRMNDRYIKVAWKHTKELPYVLLDEENLPDGYKHIMEELSLIRKYQEIWTDGKYSLYYSKPYPGPERPKITDVDPYRHHP